MGCYEKKVLRTCYKILENIIMMYTNNMFFYRQLTWFTRNNFLLFFFYLIGMPWGKRPLPQKLLLPDEEIPLRLLEYSRFVIICFANISSLRTSFFHRRDVHNLKTHVRSLSACDVHEILGSVSDSQKTGTNAYHDQRNGILKEKCCF